MRRPPGPLVGRPPDLPPASVLGLRHKHGTKMRYLAGCRCRRCRAGNARYEQKLNLARKLYGPNDLVSSERVLAHLRYLKTFGMGHKTVAKHAHVSKTALAEMIWYGRQHVRRRSENRILAVQPTLDTLPRSVNIPAKETVEKIKQLTLWGYPKSLITRDGLGNESMVLQVNQTVSRTTTVRTAVCIRDFYNLVITMRCTWQKKWPIPPRHYVYWKSGRRPEIPTIRSLVLRPFARSYDYHSLWPKELREVSRLKRQIRNQIRERRIENEKHFDGSARHAVRHAQ